MRKTVERIPQRIERGMNSSVLALLNARYHRILPLLLRLLAPADIWERNRTWPGVLPARRGATQLIRPSNIRTLRQAIDTYIIEKGQNESVDEVLAAVRSYCQYGPIGLLDVQPSLVSSLVDPDLQALVEFHHLAKHGRVDAATYILQLLDLYADNLQVPRLHPFIARYIFAQDRRRTGWYVAEGPETDHLPKTHRRLNHDLLYPHRQWRFCAIRLPFSSSLSERHPAAVLPWLLWMYDIHSEMLMGFRISPSVPTFQDVQLTLRWSIWHYGASDWKHRGAPEEIFLPCGIDAKAFSDSACAQYLHVRCVSEKREVDSPSTFPGFPEEVARWLMAGGHSDGTLYTLSSLFDALLDLVRASSEERFFAALTPQFLREQAVSLPWSNGIAAALLLTPGGLAAVRNGRVCLLDVPFDASSLPDGTEVELRFDPDDARRLYLIHDQARVTVAPASAFEGKRIPWLELVPDPALLLNLPAAEHQKQNVR